MTDFLKPYHYSLKERVEEIKQGVLDGDINPLNAMEAVKRMDEYLSDLKKSITDIALDELDKYGEKEVTFGNAKFSKSSSGRYDYSNDEEWVALNNAKKEREKTLQTAYKTKGELVVDGEVINKPIYKANKESIKIKLT